MIKDKYRIYLKTLGFADEEIHKAWEKAKKYFPSLKADNSGGLLTLEVITRNILKGEFTPFIAEVKDIE